MRIALRPCGEKVPRVHLQVRVQRQPAILSDHRLRPKILPDGPQGVAEVLARSLFRALAPQ